MQKYYHKGAFYMDESSLEASAEREVGKGGGSGDGDLDKGGGGGGGATAALAAAEAALAAKKKSDVRLRSYGEATLEDKFDKSSMPKVMQVKKFGFAGQTKYTHLKDQDTTDFEQVTDDEMTEYTRD